MTPSACVERHPNLMERARGNAKQLTARKWQSDLKVVEEHG